MSEPTSNHAIFKANGFTCAIIQRAPITEQQIKEAQQSLFNRSKTDENVSIEIQCQAKHLEGAIHFSTTVCKHLIEEFRKETKKDVSKNPSA